MTTLPSDTTLRRQQLEAELKRMLALLIEHYQPDEVVLFGSAARAEIGEWSDLDLFIVKQTDKRFSQRSIEVARILQPRIATDIIVYTPTEFNEATLRNDFFVSEEIVGKGRRLYSRTSQENVHA
jgi:uncharacterized protein